MTVKHWHHVVVVRGKRSEFQGSTNSWIIKAGRDTMWSEDHKAGERINFKARAIFRWVACVHRGRARDATLGPSSHKVPPAKYCIKCKGRHPKCIEKKYWQAEAPARPSIVFSASASTHIAHASLCINCHLRAAQPFPSHTERAWAPGLRKS